MGSIDAYESASGRRYRVRYRDPDRHQRNKRGFRTKAEAQRFLQLMEVRKTEGTWIPPELARVAVGRIAEDWMAAQLQIKPTTRSGYRHNLDKHVLPRWGARAVGDMRHAEIQAWVSSLAEGLAPSTVRQIHLTLSGVLKYAVRTGHVPANASEGVRLPRIVRKQRGYLSHAQIERLASKCAPYSDLVRFLAYTGLRWGEMAALKTSSFDLARRRVSVREAVTEPRGALIWGTPKGHEQRSVPYPRFMTDAIVSRCDGHERDGLVFAAVEGGVLRGSNFRDRVFTPAVRACQAEDPTFPRVTPHDLRHTAASLAVAAGANVKAVQRMLGHKSAAMTLDVYADLFEDDLDAVADALDIAAITARVS